MAADIIHRSVTVDPWTSPLVTDLYQLNMMQSYHDAGMEETAVFEFFVRKLPACRNFMVSAGLDQSLAFLEEARFSPGELEWLSESARFSRSFIDYLAGFKFSGDVHAMPEGTVFFPDEPVLRVTAPLLEAQLVETRLINYLHFETVIASKAARMVLAAPGKTLVDFGLRRAHGAEAGVLAARACYLAGFASTATVPAGPLFGIPIAGTMAHSFVQAHEDESAAFEHFARSHPEIVILLIDTYDTEAAARRVVDLAPRLLEDGIRIRGVRLDSGDMDALSRSVRAILDKGGLEDAIIFASGGLDEHALQAFTRSGAPIDGFGIGTSLTTSADCPALDCAYKLQEYAGRPKRKRSVGKATWPGSKQVFRRYGDDRTMQRDAIALEDESLEGEPLIRPVMRGGRRTDGLPSLEESRRHAATQLDRLPATLRTLDAAAPYPVEVSEGIRDLAQRVDAATGAELR